MRFLSIPLAACLLYAQEARKTAGAAIGLAPSRRIAIRLALQLARSDQRGECEEFERRVGLSDRRLRNSLQSTPIVIDGVMYVSTSYTQCSPQRGHWPDDLALQVSIVGKRRTIGWRGVSYQSGARGKRWQGFLGTPNSNLVAIDQKTGHELWRVNVDDSNQCGCTLRRRRWW